LRVWAFQLGEGKKGFEQMNKSWRKFLASVTMCAALVFVFNETASAQRRRTPPRGGRRATPARSASAVTTANRTARVDEVRTEVANQINNFSRFLYVYGRLARSLDETTAEARAAAQAATRSGITARTEAVDRNKTQVAQNFANLRGGLDALDGKLAAVTELARFRPELSNARTAATEASQLVAAERFDAAGRRLLDAVSTLTNLLRQIR